MEQVDNLRTPPLTEGGLTALLAKRYSAPEFAFLRQVRNQTGFARVVRTADAIAMGLYPSRGLHLHGFEVKCTRSDWTRELKDPAKADEIASRCHFWNIVTPSEKVAPIDEVPAPWGLIIPSKDGLGLRTVRAATFMADAKPLDFKFLAGVLRKASERAGRAPEEVSKEIELAKAAARKEQKEHDEYELMKTKQERDRLQELARNFLMQSGINILDYHGPYLKTHAEALSVLRGEFGRKRLDELHDLYRHVDRVLHSCATEIKNLTRHFPEPDYSI